MNTKWVGPAYSLEIVVSDRHVKEVSRVTAAMQGPVAIRDGSSPECGRSRLIFATHAERLLPDVVDPHVVPVLADAVQKALAHPSAHPVRPGRASEASLAAGDGHDTGPRRDEGDSHG